MFCPQPMKYWVPDASVTVLPLSSGQRPTAVALTYGPVQVPAELGAKERVLVAGAVLPAGPSEELNDELAAVTETLVLVVDARGEDGTELLEIAGPAIRMAALVFVDDVRGYCPVLM